jgi:hypothetical protein
VEDSCTKGIKRSALRRKKERGKRGKGELSPRGNTNYSKTVVVVVVVGRVVVTVSRATEIRMAVPGTATLILLNQAFPSFDAPS